MTNQNILPLFLPALRCKMGNWIYYATSMKLSQAAERIKFAEELEGQAPSRQLYRDWLQREIDEKRAGKIADYLLTQQERFFSSLVVTMYGGTPEWYDIGILDAQQFPLDQLTPIDLRQIDSALGLLRLSGKEELFPVDGQHRLSGIREALEQSDTLSDTLADEEISVLFVADRGIQETRRLFSTLNRYAVPINQGERIILDEDDAMAITTRNLIEKHPLFCEQRVAPPKRSSLAESDQTSYSTATTLYTIATIICSNYHEGPEWKKARLTGSMRPNDAQLEVIYNIVSQFWDQIILEFPLVGDVTKPDYTSTISQNRRKDGGHLLFRPVGQMAFVRAVKQLYMRTEPVNLSVAIHALSRLPYELSKDPWLNVIWQEIPATNSGRMIATVEAQKLVSSLMLYYSGYLTEDKEIQALRFAYRKALNSADAELPKL